MATPKIKSVSAMEILDSRGFPTVQATVTLGHDIVASASVPSGASTGAKEAVELRDNESRYGGKGVHTAVANVNGEIAKAITGKDVSDIQAIDALLIKLDGTPNKSRLGANAILAVSVACARAAALAQRLPLYQFFREVYAPKMQEWKLPRPMFNILNGGVHADSGLSVQEFMVVPKGSVFAENLHRGAEVFHHLAGLLTREGYSISVGDEGGYAPRLKSHQEAFDLLLGAMNKAGLVAGDDVMISFDAAASQFRSGADRYALRPEGTTYTTEQLINLYENWSRSYPLLSIEDGLAEDDWAGWQTMTARLGSKVMVVGDDLFVTQAALLDKGAKEKVANATIIKPNQVGTLSEAVECLRVAKTHGYQTIVSHRSGETTDTFIADLAVAIGAEYIKAGSTARGERLAKYNRLLEIERALSPDVTT